jgi:hypothetical protein
MRRTVRRALLIGTLLALSGCAHIGAQPWQRDVLARKSMQLAREPAIMAFDEHTYFSKEAASGGRSFDGGGCGCN